jgi:GNAT superfamily N-acetyltransferase
MRLATESDMPALLRMGAEFANAAGLSATDESMEFTLRALMDSGGLFVTGEPVCGMAAGLLFDQYFNRSVRAAQELFWWVDTDARRSGAGRDLLDGMEAWARTNGAQSLTMVTLQALDAESIGRFYESNGYKPLEHNYMKVL